MGKNYHFAARVTILAIDESQIQSDEINLLLWPQKDPDEKTPIFTINTELLMRRLLIDDTCQDARKHPIDSDGMKRKSDEKIDKIFDQFIHSKIRTQYGTNQKLITRTGNSHIHPTGREHELIPQSLYELITATQLVNIHRGRYLCKNPGLRINNSGRIRKKILPKREIAVSDKEKGT